MRYTFLLLLTLSAGEVSAAVVYLKDGGRLEGTILRETNGELVLRTSMGAVRIYRDKIQSVDYSAGGFSQEYNSSPRTRLSQEALFGRLRQSFSLDFGLAAPVSDINLSGNAAGSASNGDVGALIGMQYLQEISPRVQIGGEFHYYDRSATDSPGLLANRDAHVSGDALLFLGVLKYALTLQGYARPYVLGGIGAHRTSTTIDAEPNPGFAWSDTNTDETRRLVDGSAWGFAGSARLGVDFNVYDPFLFAVEAGWTVLTGASAPATAQGQAQGLSGVSGSLHFFTLAARWGWRF